MVALIVNLFKKMLGLEITEAADLIYVSLAILLIATSNYLLQKHSSPPPEDEPENELSLEVK